MRQARAIASMAVISLLTTCSESGAAMSSLAMTPAATVVQKCSIANASMSFPNYDPLSSSATATTASVSVTCTKGTTGASVGLDNGLNSANASGGQHRAMKSGTHYLSYDIWQDAAHTIFWGNTAGTNAEAVPVPTSATAQTLTAFGQIPAKENAPAGSYADSVVETVNF
jgi:spore coat protein U-like protein